MPLSSSCSGGKGLRPPGAPIEHLDFQDVTYWPEMVEVMEWTQSHVHATLGVCWGGMAMINHLHGVKKHDLPQKAFAVFDIKTWTPPRLICVGFRMISWCPSAAGQR